jgi:hypothetical protein
MHRLPLTGSRWDIRLLSLRVKTPTFCVFPLFSVAVMEKSYDARGDGEYYLRSGCSVSADISAVEASVADFWKSIQHTVTEWSWEDADFLWVSCIWRGGYGKVFGRLR